MIVRRGQHLRFCGILNKEMGMSDVKTESDKGHTRLATSASYRSISATVLKPIFR